MAEPNKDYFQYIKERSEAQQITFADLKRASNLVYVALHNGNNSDAELEKVGGMMFVLDEASRGYSPKPGEKEGFRHLLMPSNFYGLNAFYGDGVNAKYFEEGFISRAGKRIISAAVSVRDFIDNKLPAVETPFMNDFFTRIDGSNNPVIITPTARRTYSASRTGETAIGWPPVETTLTHTGYSIFATWHSKTATGRSVYFTDETESYSKVSSYDKYGRAQDLVVKIFEATLDEARRQAQKYHDKEFRFIGRDGEKDLNHYLKKTEALEQLKPLYRNQGLAALSGVNLRCDSWCRPCEWR